MRCRASAAGSPEPRSSRPPPTRRPRWRLACWTRWSTSSTCSIGQPHFFMYKANVRKATNLVMAQNTARQGRVHLDQRHRAAASRYDGVPIHVVEDGWDASTLLAQDEDPGNGSRPQAPSTRHLRRADGRVRADLGRQWRPAGLGPRGGRDDRTGSAPGIIGTHRVLPGHDDQKPTSAVRLRNGLA